MAQTVDPFQDITSPVHMTSPFATAVYDKTGVDDLTYAVGLFEPLDTDDFEISLLPPAFLPNGSTLDVTLRCKASTTSAVDTFTASLYEAGVLRGSVDIGLTLTTSFQDFVINGTGITDYTALTLVFSIEVTSGTRSMYCSYVSGSAPDPRADDYYATAQSLTTMGCGSAFNVAT